MSTEEKDQELFRSLVEGEVAESATRVKDMFARRKDLEREWRETTELFAALEVARLDRKATLEQSAALADVPGEEAAGRALRAAMGSTTDEATRAIPRPAHTFARPIVWVGFAAALVLGASLVYFLALPHDARDGRHGVLLGGPHELEAAAPETEDAGSLVLRWKGRAPPGSRFEAKVEGFDDATSMWREVASKKLDVTPWTVERERARSWPRRLRWRVVAYNAEALVADSAWLEFERSP